MPSDDLLKGRGAQGHVPNRFLQYHEEAREDFLEYCRLEGEVGQGNRTRYIPIFPKTIVNPVKSPDLPMAYSMNPYQGCEHGCIYCYARNTHEYWGYGAGLDFERIVLVKESAPELLESKLKGPRWKAATIMLSGNTDCYQPAEKKYGITRKCLEVFLRYRHPVGIITKNSLILRDLDLLGELHAHGLVGVTLSITSLSEETRRILEPRTASIQKRLDTLGQLSAQGIPVGAMLAPIIPGINGHELLPLARTVAEHGALAFGMSVVRLNGAIGQLFTQWIRKAMPERADKVLHQIRELHGGGLNDSRIGIRHKGEGQWALQLRQTAQLARKRYFGGRAFPQLNTELHAAHKEGQLRLF